jgi:hypothetical protein
MDFASFSSWFSLSLPLHYRNLRWFLCHIIIFINTNTSTHHHHQHTIIIITITYHIQHST